MAERSLVLDDRPAASFPPGKPGFFGGMSCFFQGFSLLWSNPRAWPLAIVPAASAVLLMATFMTLSIVFVPDLIDRWTGGGGGFWVSVLSLLAQIVAVIASVFLALVLAQPASGPALEALVRATQRRLGIPEQPNTPFWLDVGRSAVSAAFSLAVGGSIFVVLLVISLIPGAAVVTVPLEFAAAAILIGWDVCDYPLTVRGVPFRERVAFIARNGSAVLGFSAGLAAVALIPCGFLLLLPVGVAGATAFVARIEAWERTEGAKRLGGHREGANGSGRMLT